MKFCPQATYNWMPVNKTSDGLTTTSGFSDFNFTTPSSSDASWKKTSEITLYDVYSHALEGADINGNSAATRMGYNSSKVVVSGGPAKYNEIAFSGAEDALVSSRFGGGPGQGTGSVVGKTSDGALTHTGEKSILCTPGQTAFTYSPSVSSLSSRDYFVSVWVKAAGGASLPSAQICYAKDGNAATPIALSASNARQSGTSGWYLLTGRIPSGSFAGGTTLNAYVKNSGSSGNVYFDDFRFSPQSASTTAYVYDPFSGELTYVLGNNNLYTRFEYDGAGRMVRTYAEKLSTGEFKVAEYQYNFGQAQYKSAAINQNYTRNNCPANYSGTSVPVFVAEGTFVSGNSQSEADQQAQTYAQNLANQQGSCALSTVSLSLSNWAGAGSSYVARFTSTQNSANYVFNFPSSGTTSNLSLPVDTYNLYVYPMGSSSGSYKFVYTVGPNSGNSTGTSATFNNVVVNSNITVSIQTP